MVRFLTRSSSAGLLCVLAAGCGPGPRDEATQGPPLLPSAPASASEDDPCGASALSALLQRTDSPQIRASVAQFAGGDPVRWVRPGRAVTTDYVPERLNIVLDDANRIVALRCG
ncbi:I78 family peptidase inhibitor [Novosphingobium olei]|uniref:I78 family peptidase inhibitor n=1 Tax=Novosphingobium olei TaxID=2728851 RepID=UPI00308B8D97|nr:I78 family peptidase inhibitor [Novosphingobium olei]